MRRRNTQQCISFWQPVAPPGYLPLGHVPSIGLDPPADPVLVYRNDSEKGSRPSVKPAQEFHLIWAQPRDHVGATPTTRLQSAGDCGGPRCRAARQQRVVLRQRGPV